MATDAVRGLAEVWIPKGAYGVSEEIGQVCSARVGTPYRIVETPFRRGLDDIWLGGVDYSRRR